jgi:hypothetical protein
VSIRISGAKPCTSCASPGVSTKPRGLPFPSQRAWSVVVKPPLDRPSASVARVPFLCRPRSGALGRSCCRSYRQSVPGLPSQPASPAWRRTHPSRPSVASAGRRCSTSRTRPAGGATVSPSAPSTSCLRTSAVIACGRQPRPRSGGYSGPISAHSWSETPIRSPKCCLQKAALNQGPSLRLSFVHESLAVHAPDG